MHTFLCFNVFGVARMLVDVATLIQVGVLKWLNRQYHWCREDGRYALNWIKLRAWELVQYNALLLVDADTVVVQNISSVFHLPTDFAVVLDQDRRSRRSALFEVEHVPN